MMTKTTKRTGNTTTSPTENKRVIFVTVGNGQFDPLVREIDTLVREKKISDPVIIQLGTGTYLPQHCRWFRFESDLQQYYRDASLVISHGGPGTVFEVLRLKKRLIALPNRDRTDPQHQVEYLQAMAAETSALLYCEHPSLLAEVLEKAKTHSFAEYVEPECEMHQVVHKFLGKEE